MSRPYKHLEITKELGPNNIKKIIIDREYNS
jgi:hypothetical protein